MMTMTIAHWKLVVQVRRQPSPAAPDASQALVERVQRRQLDSQIARSRDQADARRILLGGPSAR